MNKRVLCMAFALLLSLTLVLSATVQDTTAYVFSIAPTVCNTFSIDPNDFPATPVLPDTGDDSSIVLYGALLLVSAGGLLLLRRRKHAC